MTEEDAVLVCRALGDPNRMRIVAALTGGEECACRLLEQFDITQPTLSHHMKILVDSGLVRVRRDGKWMHYSLDCAVFRAFKQYVGELVVCDKGGQHEQKSCGSADSRSLDRCGGSTAAITDKERR